MDRRRIETVACFKRYFLAWRLLGLVDWPANPLCRLYDALLTIFITFGYPMHLILGLAFSANQETFFSNLTIATSSISCGTKHFIYRFQLQKIQRVCQFFDQLDERSHTGAERRYFDAVMARPCRFMTNFFFRLYFGICAVGMLRSMVTHQLLYPAYTPFDWQASFPGYAVALAYQFIGLAMQILQNLTNDLYGPLTLCMLAGHVHLLSMRLSRIAHADKEDDQQGNYSALTGCIEDFKVLKSTARIVEDILTLSYLVQFVAVGINVCVGLIVLLFVANSMLSYIYHCLHMAAILLELFPCCYYGSQLELEFHQLSYAIFSSNWYTQRRPFRQNMVIFTEHSLKEVILYAGGMIRIHLDSFFATCKMAYSIFTVVQSMK